MITVVVPVVLHIYNISEVRHQDDYSCCSGCVAHI